MYLKKSHILPVIFFVLLFLQGVNCLYAQKTLVDVQVGAASILIGEQTNLRLTVTTDKDKQLAIPLPSKMLMDGIEVLTIDSPDTTDIKNGRITIDYNLLITSFDSSLYLLPPFIAIDGTDTVYSNQVALKVLSPEVNLENPEEYFDIKTIWNPPFVLSDYYALVFGVLFTLFIICVIGYFVQRMRKRKAENTDVIEEPKLPPHEQAIRELKDIREQKLWQQGRNKKYYTEITDTLRRYITRRYGVSVMEKTSLEILEIIYDKEPGNKEVYDTLKQILSLSDYVKFAKMQPLPDENDLSMMNANLFIDKTKHVEAIPTPASAESEEKEVEENENENESTINS